jgi:23S rRNA (cytidine1920-2'-O)/16S rRNA (cytidine1409-2'-O)-methyltransferase
VTVTGKVITKPGFAVSEDMRIVLDAPEQYVSRAGLKLASVTEALKVSFKDKVVLDVGSSTGGFTDYALQHGAKKVIAVDVGTEQLHPSLRGDSRIDLREKTDIRTVVLEEKPDSIVIDVSFISLREILPHLAEHTMSQATEAIAMLKPQFEAGRSQANKGVIKNDTIRRAILKDFEAWSKQYFVIIDKADSAVAGGKGNRERFYLLKRR